MLSLGLYGPSIYLLSNPILSHGFQEQTQTKSFEVPLLAFTVRMPCDGLPMLEDWLTHAASIWAIGWYSYLKLKEVLLNPPGKEEFTKHLGLDFLLGAPSFRSWFWHTWGYSCIAFEVSMFPNFQG